MQEGFVYQIVNRKQWIKQGLICDTAEIIILRTLGDRGLREHVSFINSFLSQYLLRSFWAF